MAEVVLPKLQDELSRLHVSLKSSRLSLINSKVSLLAQGYPLQLLGEP
jgi:hypothetical protein